MKWKELANEPLFNLECFLDSQDKELFKRGQEIVKLKNIINELEKYIVQEWYCFDNESIEFEVSKNILDKIQELKKEMK